VPWRYVYIIWKVGGGTAGATAGAEEIYGDVVTLRREGVGAGQHRELAAIRWAVRSANFGSLLLTDDQSLVHIGRVWLSLLVRLRRNKPSTRMHVCAATTPLAHAGWPVHMVPVAIRVRSERCFLLRWSSSLNQHPPCAQESCGGNECDDFFAGGPRTHASSNPECSGKNGLILGFRTASRMISGFARQPVALVDAAMRLRSTEVLELIAQSEELNCSQIRGFRVLTKKEAEAKSPAQLLFSDQAHVRPVVRWHFEAFRHLMTSASRTGTFQSPRDFMQWDVSDGASSVYMQSGSAELLP